MLLNFISPFSYGQMSFSKPANYEDSLALTKELRAQGLELIETMHYLESELVLLKAYEIVKHLKNPKLMGNIGNNLAECYSTTGRHQKAEETYFEAFDLFSSINDTAAMAGILINLGDEYAKTGKLKMAIETELRAIRLKELSNDTRKLAFYYQKLGELFCDIDLAKWEKYAMKALALSRNPENTTWYATIAIYNDLGAIWNKKGNYKLAEMYYDTMYSLSKEAEFRKGVNTAKSEIALMLHNQGRFEEALPIISEALESIRDTDDIYQIVYGSTLKAIIYLKLNKPQEAIKLLQPAIEMANNAHLLAEEMNAAKYLSEAYFANGQWKYAFQSQKKYTILKDSLASVEIKNALYDLNLKFETEIKQQTIDNLTELNFEQSKRSRLLIILLSASASILLLLGFIVRLRNKTIKQNRALFEKEQKILKLEHARLLDEIDFKSRELASSTVHLINKNEVMNDLKKQLSANLNSLNLEQVIKTIDQNINLDKDWHNFRRHFEKIHPDFFQRLKASYSGLTPNEERLCAYLRLNMSSKELSLMLNITSSAVDKSRNRLRKKLEILPTENLNNFITKI
jgi:tetratricopeptide (TPR) repeat protein